MLTKLKLTFKRNDEERQQQQSVATSSNMNRVKSKSDITDSVSKSIMMDTATNSNDNKYNNSGTNVGGTVAVTYGSSPPVSTSSSYLTNSFSIRDRSKSDPTLKGVKVPSLRLSSIANTISNSINNNDNNNSGNESSTTGDTIAPEMNNNRTEKVNDETSLHVNDKSCALANERSVNNINNTKYDMVTSPSNSSATNNKNTINSQKSTINTAIPIITQENNNNNQQQDLALESPRNHGVNNLMKIYLKFDSFLQQEDGRSEFKAFLEKLHKEEQILFIDDLYKMRKQNKSTNDICKLIIQKYLSKDSKYELNIKHSLRMDFINIVNDKTIEEEQKLKQIIKIEREIIHQLKKESFSKFKKTSEYQVFILSKALEKVEEQTLEKDPEIKIILEENELQEYNKLFKKKKIERLSQLVGYTQQDLKNLGINKLGHQKKLLRIVKLKFGQPEQVTVSTTATNTTNGNNGNNGNNNTKSVVPSSGMTRVRSREVDLAADGDEALILDKNESGK